MGSLRVEAVRGVVGVAAGPAAAAGDGRSKKACERARRPAPAPLVAAAPWGGLSSTTRAWTGRPGARRGRWQRLAMGSRGPRRLDWAGTRGEPASAARRGY